MDRKNRKYKLRTNNTKTTQKCCLWQLSTYPELWAFRFFWFFGFCV